MSIHDTKPKNAIQGSYIYTFTSATQVLVQESYNLMSAIEKLGYAANRIDKHGTHYLQSTPFDQRERSVWLTKVGELGSEYFTVTQKWATYKLCNACYIHKAIPGTTKCESCTGVLKQFAEEHKKRKQMTEYEECTAGKTVIELVKDFEYQISLGYSGNDSYPSFLRELINKKLSQYD